MALGIKVPKNTFTAGRERFAKGDDYGNVELDPGKYICQVVKGRGQDTDKGPKIVLDLTVAGESDKAGGKISIWYNLSEEHVIWLFRTLSILGYEVADLDEKMLDEILADIEKTKPVVRVKATRRDDNMNYRIEKLLTDVTVADVTAEASVETNTAEEPAAEETVDVPAEPVAKPAAAKTPAPKPVPTAKSVAPAKAPDPAPTAVEEVVTEDEVVEEDEEVSLKIGSEVPATLKSGKHVLVVTAIHEEEQKITGKSKTDGKLYKCGLDKLG